MRPGIGRAAVMIGVITILARLVGFGRQVVFAHTVGTTCLGTAYTTANMVPNIIYDIVLGGALSSVVVPVLAGPGAGRGRLVRQAAFRPASAEARRIASALLTWTVLLLVPVSAALALAAHPIVTALLSGAPGCPHGPLAGVGARMLIVFAPQVLLYGLAVVLYGILQSHRRFGAPALAPLLSSLVVIGAYTAFGEVGGALRGQAEQAAARRRVPAVRRHDPRRARARGDRGHPGVAAGRPARRRRCASRPGSGSGSGGWPWRAWPPWSPRTPRSRVVIVLANHFGSGGSLVIYGFAWAVFVVPYAVLAVPIATSAFPELSTHDADDGGTGDRGTRGNGGFDLTAAASTRAVTLASWLGAAVLIGAREPLARVFEPQSAHSSAATAAVLALALAAFAPGLVGYGLSANLSRVLYARRRNRAPALAIAGGWLLVIAADVAIVPFVPASRVVPVARARHHVRPDRVRDRAAGPGPPRMRARGAARGAAGVPRRARRLRGGRGGRRGRVVGRLRRGAGLPAGGFLRQRGLSVLVAVVVTAAFAVVVLCLDVGDVRGRAVPPAHPPAASRPRPRPRLPSPSAANTGWLPSPGPRRKAGRPSSASRAVTLVLGAATGGTGAHVRMLAAGLAAPRDRGDGGRAVRGRGPVRVLGAALGVRSPPSRSATGRGPATLAACGGCAACSAIRPGRPG